MKAKCLIVGVGLCAAVVGANAVHAAPIAARAPVSKNGKLLNYDWEGRCPDVKGVGVTAYPGSVCLTAAAFNKATAFVNLASSADAAKVADWYGKQLNGWTRTKAVTGEIVFTPPGERTNASLAAFTSIHVSIERMTKGKVKIKKMIYVFKKTPATLIHIDYALKRGSK